MVMPLWDHNPFKWPKPPYVMWSIVIINFLVYFIQVSGGPEEMEVFDHMAGLVPSALSGHGAVPGALPAPLTLITSMFLHANFMHVFGNMIFLFVFGDDIEEALGSWRFLLFYFACGLVAALAFVLSDPGSHANLIGASGAVAGVISAYLLYRPCAKVYCLLDIIPLRLRAYWIIGFWVLWQIIQVANSESDGVAYWAHIGGLIAGAVLFVVLRPAGVPLLQCVDDDAVQAGGTTS
jgi:membrane associated rhomboid family serine protease